MGSGKRYSPFSLCAVQFFKVAGTLRVPYPGLLKSWGCVQFASAQVLSLETVSVSKAELQLKLALKPKLMT